MRRRLGDLAARLFLELEMQKSKLIDGEYLDHSCLVLLQKIFDIVAVGREAIVNCAERFHSGFRRKIHCLHKPSGKRTRRRVRQIRELRIADCGPYAHSLGIVGVLKLGAMPAPPVLASLAPRPASLTE